MHIHLPPRFAALVQPAFGTGTGFAPARPPARPVLTPDWAMFRAPTDVPVPAPGARQPDPARPRTAAFERGRIALPPVAEAPPAPPTAWTLQRLGR